MARLSHVIVIDSDPKGLQAMAFGFERDGVRATPAASIDEALAILPNDRPDAVVVTLRQGPDASRFILDGLSTGSQLPVVALGTEDHRRAAAGQANVDFLTVPAYLRDVITATRIRAACRQDGKDPVVQGALSEYGLFFILRTILASRQSATVQVERANRKGELKICKGELRTAQVGTITGAPALNHLLLWEEAALEIRFKPVTARSQFNNKGSALIEDVERFLRDFAHTARVLGSAQTVYEVSPTANTDVAPEVAPVLRLFDGQRAISDVLDESPFRVFDTLRIISRFSETEIIRKKAGVEARPAVSTSAASPLMEAWLKGDTERERIDAAVAAAVSAQKPPAAEVRVQSGGTGPLPSASQFRAEPVNAEARVTPPQAGGVTTGAVTRSTRGEMVARSSDDKARHRRPSMVIDLPTESLDVSPPPIVSELQAPVTPRATGSLDIPTLPRMIQRTPSPRSSGSIELDPALMAEMEAPRPVRVPTPAPIAPLAPAPVLAHPKRTGPQPNPFAAKTRTGEFDELEKDFFEREKDLYKSDNPDSFDDL